MCLIVDCFAYNCIAVKKRAIRTMKRKYKRGTSEYFFSLSNSEYLQARKFRQSAH
jgi:hypothetical protein